MGGGGEGGWGVYLAMKLGRSYSKYWNRFELTRCSFCEAIAVTLGTLRLCVKYRGIPRRTIVCFPTNSTKEKEKPSFTKFSCFSL